MSIEWLLYLIDVLGALCFMFSILLFCGCLIFPFSSIIYYSNKDCDDDVTLISLKVIKISSIVIIMSILGCILIPSQKTMYAIAFAQYSKQSDIPSKVLKAIEVKLDEVIKLDSAQK